MAGSPDVLVKGAVLENYMSFWMGQPSLKDLSEVLEKICDNLREYKLWPVSLANTLSRFTPTEKEEQENCWLMCSLLQEIFQRSHDGRYKEGGSVSPNLAPKARRRIILDLMQNSALTNKESLPSVSVTLRSHNGSNV